MKLLDQLKKESEKARLENSQNLSIGAEQDLFYETRLKPALFNIRDYLVELTEQLDFLGKEIQIPFDIPGYGIIETRQYSRRVNIDSVENIKRLDFHAIYVAKRLEFTVTPLERAEETRNFLREQQQAYSDFPIRGPNGPVMGFRFLLTNLELQGSVNFQIDKSRRRIRMRSANLYDFIEDEEYLHAEDINEDWLDQLGRKIVGDRGSTGPLEITEAEKGAIRRKLASDKETTRHDVQQTKLHAQKVQDRPPEELGEKLRSGIGRLKDAVHDLARKNPHSDDTT